MSPKNTMPLSNRHFSNTVFACCKPNRFSLIFFLKYPGQKEACAHCILYSITADSKRVCSFNIYQREGRRHWAYSSMTCYTAAKMNEPDRQQSKQVSRDSLMSEKSPFQSENSSVILFMLEMLKKESYEWRGTVEDRCRHRCEQTREHSVINPAAEETP